MSEYASKGLAGTALGTGIGGLAISLLNGGVGNLLGGCGNGCGDNAYVTRYDASKDAEIARLQSQIELRDANFYAIGEVGKLRDYMENRFDKVEHEICDQKVMNATMTSNMSCMASQIAALNSLTKLIVPNSSVCPGWGNVNVTIPTTTA